MIGYPRSHDKGRKLYLKSRCQNRQEDTKEARSNDTVVSTTSRRDGRKAEWVRPGVVANSCNPNYSGGRDQGMAIHAQPRQKVNKILSQQDLGGKHL
jgi:hypothetical protein